ncbi:MAG: hypothetical protein HY903_17165 [Deltaproteobacteria bacterium]|nr:hypothetical protein [Deltaproteobacteria bacterium]
MSAEMTADCSSKSGKQPTPPRITVGFHELRLEGQAEKQGEVRALFEELLPSGTDKALLFTLNGVELMLEAQWLGGARHARLFFIRAVRFGHQVVASLELGCRTRRCKPHRRLRGEHKRGGKWRAGCYYEAQGLECPSDHYNTKPRRCGCELPDDLYWKCPDCRELNGHNCPTCQRAKQEAPDIFIRVTGLGCQLGLLEPIVQQFFARFVCPVTVVRHEVHIKADFDEPQAALIPFQTNDGPSKVDSPVKTPPAPASKRSIAAKLVYGVHVPTHLSPASPVRC